MAVLMTTMLPRLLKNRSTMVLVLSGIIVSGFFGAVMGIIKFVADPQTELAEITYWTMGSIAGANMQDVFSVLPAMAVAAVILLRMRWRVNLLSLGDGEAKTLGVNIRAVRGLMVLCSTILTACAVSVSYTHLPGTGTLGRGCAGQLYPRWNASSYGRLPGGAHRHRAA